MAEQSLGSTTSRQRAIEQERAKAAWGDVAAVKSEKHKKEYGQLARSAAADIQVNGLGQVLAFWRAKGKPEHKDLYKDVNQWVRSRLGIAQPEDLLQWIMQRATTDEYRHATAEALAFLTWLKRFAEAELGGD